MSEPDLLHDLRSAPDPRDPRAPSLLCPLSAEAELRDRTVLLGLPYDGGIPSRPGARFGPRALRGALAAFGTWDDDRDLAPVEDAGDLALPPMDAAEAHARIEEAARRLFAAGACPIFLGGDHGCTGSVIRGLAAARPGLRLALVTIDAHLDVRAYERETALSSGTPFRRALETEIVEGSRVAMIGLRRFANSRYYGDWVRERGIHLFGTDEVERIGAVPLAQEALQRVMWQADALYLSIDLDAADAAFAPGTSAAGPGGLTAREMIALVRTIAEEPRLIGADVMELSPPHDEGDRTARLGARLLLELLAQRAS